MLLHQPSSNIFFPEIEKDIKSLILENRKEALKI